MEDPAANGQPQSSPSPDRTWTIPTAFRLPSGEVVPDRGAMREALEEIGPILTRLGGTVTMSTRRVEVVPDLQTETTAVVVQWYRYSSRAGGPEAVSQIPMLEPQAA